MSRLILRAAILATGAFSAGCGDDESQGSHRSEPAAAPRAEQGLDKQQPRAKEISAQRSGDRKQETGVRSRESGVRGQGSEVTGQESDSQLSTLNSQPEDHSPLTTDDSPNPVFRPSDDRPQHDDQRLARHGIRRYESRRLVLYTDIDPEIARTLPPYIDGACKAWVAYFGELPPDRENSEFQITGYLMQDAGLFRRLGLVPDDLRPFTNGRHRGYELWMNEQTYDCYRRHLMIHEATHCFMYAVRDERFPAWYMEGMAELFGTHASEANGEVHFGVMPQQQSDYPGFGRITLIRDACRDGRFRTVSAVTGLAGDDFLSAEAYAWTWALCRFFDSHPRYREAFRKLGRVTSSRQFVRQFETTILQSDPRLPTRWALFAHNLIYGYDLDRAAVEFREGRPLASGDDRVRIQLAADRGWQSSGVRVEKGGRYRVTARGRFTLAETPQPWLCEPQGVSVLYFGGRPLGMLLAAVDWQESGVRGQGSGVRDQEPGVRDHSPLTTHYSPQQSSVVNRQSSIPPAGLLEVIPVGRGREFTAPASGALYFRVNDAWSRLADNRGAVEIVIERMSIISHQSP